MKLAVERSTPKVFSLVGALAVLGTLLFATSAVAAKEAPRGATGATGPTGPAGANGTNGEKGATGPAGTGGTEKNAVACEKGVQSATCTLASGFQETGTWSVHVSAPTGAPQVDAVVPISFPVRLKLGSLVTKATYRNQTQTEVEIGKAPCAGTMNEPKAEPGALCVYTGAALGGVEAQRTNVEFHQFIAPNGESFTINPRVGALGEGLEFRSLENSLPFKEESPAPGEAPYATITHAAYMAAFGAWAVTEK